MKFLTPVFGHIQQPVWHRLSCKARTYILYIILAAVHIFALFHMFRVEMDMTGDIVPYLYIRLIAHNFLLCFFGTLKIVELADSMNSTLYSWSAYIYTELETEKCLQTAAIRKLYKSFECKMTVC